MILNDLSTRRLENVRLLVGLSCHSVHLFCHCEPRCNRGMAIIEIALAGFASLATTVCVAERYSDKVLEK